MGFDSDCVLNIQTVAGEYFCPVCRSLIYPNEALQSQCTHLYCKPCLAYVVSTTRACPYDGYLVTEADSKPLIESNKALADTIGMVKVHCLYHRSGCTWEGPLSESTSHCAGCSFGNSAVVCNRCGIQIVHRQVQEHAQNCPVVQPQAHGETTQAVASSGTTSAVDQSQVATHVGTSVTQAQPNQTMAGQDPNQQSNLTAQSQSSVQAAVPTAEQWYQQQQQYYQQYPGYYPYQLQYQQYYPYQQPAAAQHPQSQAYMQPVAAQPQPQAPLQTQPQAPFQTQPQAPLQTQPQAALQTQPQAHLHSQQPSTQLQSQSQVNSQLQTHSLTQQQPHMQSQTHPLPGGQQHFQAPTLPQTHPVQPHPQQVHMPPYQQPQSQMQHQTPVPTQNPVAQQPVQPHPQSFSQPNQLVNPHVHPQPQPLPQHSSTHAVTGHHSYPQFQSQQQMQPGGPHMYPQGGTQLQSQHPVQMQNQFPEQTPPVRPPQPPSHHQYVQQQQQPFLGQALGSVQCHVHQQGAYTNQHSQVQSQLRPQGQSPSFHQPSHAYPHPHQSVALPHGMQPPQTQNLGGRPISLADGVPIQPHPYSSGGFQGKPMQVGTSQQSGNALMINNFERGLEGDASLNNDKRNSKDVVVAPGLDADASEVKKIKNESESKPLNDENKSIDETKHASGAPSTEKGEQFFRQVKDEPADGKNDHKDVLVADNKQVGLSVSEDKDSQSRNLTQSTGGYVGSSTLQAPPGSSHYTQFPGHASSQIRPFGLGNIPHSGQPSNPLPEYLQQPSHKQSHGPEVSPGIAGPGSTSNFGQGQGSYESDMFPNQRPNYGDDRRLDPLGKHSSAVKMNGAALGQGLHDDRWKPLPEEHMNPFSQDPARRVFKRGEFEEDLKHFPRTSDLDIDSDRKFGNHLLSSRPLDRGAHGFGPEKLGVPAPRFFPHHHDGAMHPNGMGERPIGFHEKTAGGQSEISRNRDFFGPTGRYEMVPRSPHRDHAPHRIGAFPGRDDVDGAESRRFGDPFPGSRLPGLRSHLHRGEFVGSVQQGFPSHLRRGEHFGPHSLRGHLGEPIGVEGFHSHARMGELPGPRNFFQPQLGEPGYRSNFSLKEYHGDNGSYTSDLESFDNLKRRKPSSMGWCRICKLDCETVEGLDLHSQSRDHQKKALDMVLIIKQNAKKQKLASVDRPSLDDVSKSRISSFEGGRHK